jgi:NADPH-dependent 2,4-dienoyl-CoA reductase/sulfur reductase-like enzyme
MLEPAPRLEAAMPQYRYLIIGGGMTADAAAGGIREVDANGTIGLVGAEPDAPYDRPPLTKALWKGAPLESVWRRTESKGVAMHLGRTIALIDTKGRRARDDRGGEYAYERLLLATGVRPRRLPFGGDAILHFRTLGDYRHLRALADAGQRFAVIGGGFIGTEIAAALALNGKEVVLLFPEQRVCDRVFPATLATFVTDFYREKGVDVRAGASVVAIDVGGTRPVLRTAAGETIAVDGVVAGIGTEPNVAIAREAGLAVGDGILVDAMLRTSDPDIWAAGDVAAFESPALERRLRVEHEDNANSMGRVAGRNMAGGTEPYDHLPSFYSDLFELGYEAVGLLDARLETFADWKEPNREGVVYYLAGGRVRGVLLWNVWQQVDAARRLVGERGPFTPAALRRRLPAAAPP